MSGAGSENVWVSFPALGRGAARGAAGEGCKIALQ